MHAILYQVGTVLQQKKDRGVFMLNFLERLGFFFERLDIGGYLCGVFAFLGAFVYSWYLMGFIDALIVGFVWFMVHCMVQNAKNIMIGLGIPRIGAILAVVMFWWFMLFHVVFQAIHETKRVQDLGMPSLSQSLNGYWK